MAVFVLAALVLLIAAAIVAYPLVFGPLESHIAVDMPDEEYRESDSLLEAMSELEHSFGVGKLTEQDYQTEKLRLQNQYIIVAATPAKPRGK